jgi:hypothetical protein
MQRALPAELHAKQGDPHRLGPTEIERRKKEEKKIGDKNFIEPENVKNTLFAHDLWVKILEMNKKVDFTWLTSADVTVLTMVCMTAAELNRLENLQNTAKFAETGLFMDLSNTLDKKRKMLIYLM